MTRLIDKAIAPKPAVAGFCAARRLRRDAAGARRDALCLRRDAPPARAPGTPVSAKVRWGMLIDLNKCADGCDDA